MAALSEVSSLSARNKALLAHPRVEEVIRRLEAACIRVQTDDAIPVMSRDSASSQHIPQRIREIVDECLNGPTVSITHLRDLPNGHGKGLARDGIDGMSDVSPSTVLEDENALLQKEVRRLESLLKKSRADREDLGEKYISVSERLERALRYEQDKSSIDMEHQALLEQSSRLKRQLTEQQEEYKVEIKGYQDSQEKQAILVQKLQSKLLQYKQKCGELEDKVVLEEKNGSEKQSELERTVATLQGQLSAASQKMVQLRDSHTEELHAALSKVDEEKKKTTEARAAFARLQQQMQEMKEQNQRLTMDIHKLTTDWTHAREMLEHKDRECDEKLKTQVQIMTSTFKTQLSSLLPMLSTLKTQQLILKTDVERDVGNLSVLVANALKELLERFQQEQHHYEEQVFKWQSKSNRQGEDLRQAHEEINGLKLSSEQNFADCQKRTMEMTQKLDDVNREKLSLQQLLDGREDLIRLLNEKIASLEVQNSELTEQKTDGQVRLESVETANVLLQDALKQVASLVQSQSAPKDKTAEPVASLPLVLSSDRVSPVGLCQPSPGHTQSLGSSPKSVGKTKRTLVFTSTRIPVRPDSAMHLQGLFSPNPRVGHSPKQDVIHKSSSEGSLTVSSSSSSTDVQSQLATGHSIDDHQMQSIAMPSSASDSGVESLVMETMETVKQCVECSATEKEKLQMLASRLEADCQEKDRQVESLEGEGTALAKAIAVLKTDLETSNQTIADVTHAKDQCREEMERSQNENDSLKRQLSDSEACCLDIQNRLEKLKNEVEQLSEVNQGLLQTRNDLEVTNQELTDELVSVKEKVEESQEKVAEGEEAMKELESEMSHLKRQINDLQKTGDDLQNEMTVLRTERSELQSNLAVVEQTKDDVERRLTRSKESYKSLKDENTKLIGQAAALDDKVAHLESRLRDVTVEKDSASTRATRLSQSAQKLSTDVDDLQHQVARYETSVQQLNDQLAVVNKNKIELSSQLTHSQHHVRQLEQSLSSARTQLTTVQQTVKQLADEKAHLDVEKMGMERRLASMKDENTSLEIALDTARRNVREATERVSDMKIRLEREVTKVAVESEAKKQLELDLSQVQTQLNGTLSEKEDEVIRLLTEKTALENRLEELNNERDSLISASQEERDALVEQFKREDERKRLEAERMREETVLNVSRERRMEVGKLENEKAALVEQLRKLQRDKEAGELKMSTMHSMTDYAALKEQQESLEQRVFELESELQDSKMKTRSTKQTLTEKEAEVDRIIAELRIVRSSAENSRCALEESKKLASELESSRQKHVEELKELKSQLRSVEQEKEESVRETERVRQRLKDLEERKKSLQQERGQLLENISELEKSSGGQQFEVDNLKLKLSQDESELMTLGMQLQNARHKLGAAEESHLKAQQENVQLRMSQQECEEQYLELRRQSESLSLKAAQLKEAVAGKESEVRELTRRLEAEMRSKCEAQSQLIECQRKLQLEISSSEEQRVRVTALEAQVDIITGSALRAPSSPSSKLQQALEESRQQLRAIEQIKASLETRVHVLDAENASLSSQLLVVKEDRKRLQRDLHGLISAVESPRGARGDESVLESGFHSGLHSSPRVKPHTAVRLFQDSPYGRDTVVEQSRPELMSSPLPVSSSKVKQIEGNLVSLKNILKNKERELASVRSESLDKDTKIWELETLVSKTKSRLDGLGALLGHFSLSGQSPGDKLSSLEGALYKQNENNLKLEREASTLRADLARLRLKLQSVESELESMREQNHLLRESRDALLEGEVARKRAGTYAKEKEQEAEKIRQKLSATRRDLLHSQKQEEANASEIMRLTTDLKQIQDTFSRQQRHAAEVSKELPILSEQKIRLEAEIITSKATVARLEREMAELKQQLAFAHDSQQNTRSHKLSLEQKSRELESAVLVQRGLIAELEAKLSATKRELESNVQRASALEMQLRNCAGERDALCKRVEILKRTQKESETQISSLQLRLSDLQKLLNHTETAQIRATGDLKESEEVRRQTREELKSVRFQLETVKREYEKVQTELSRCVKESANMKSELEQERARYMKLLQGSNDQSQMSQSLARDLENDKDSLKRKLMIQEAENRELESRLLQAREALRLETEELTQRVSRMEVAHESELQRMYDVQRRSESETVDRLRQRIRELEAKVTKLQTELADRARKKQRYIAKTAEKDREIRKLQGLLGDSFRNVAGSSFLDPDVLQRETSRLNQSGMSVGSEASRHSMLSPVYSSTPRGTRRK